MLTFPTALERVKAGENPQHLASELLNELTQDERLHLLHGDTPFYPGMLTIFNEGYNLKPYPHGTIPRLGIPGILFADGPRGVVVGQSTAFPVSMARGATWDVSLEEEVGVAIGLEARAQGANYFGGVCVNLPRHPAWGRAQETYSEDPVLLGAFGAALTRGVQRNVMACVKHYALNSMENARFSVDVSIDEAVLHEVYLPHFKEVLDAGCYSVMSAYNSVNGEWCGQNKMLLSDILRGMWGFKGFVLSDFIFGLRDGALSLKNGLDVEAPFAQQRPIALRQGLDEGFITMDDVNLAGQRILAAQLDSYAKRDSEEPNQSVVFCRENRDLARRVASRTAVLLKNEKVDGQPLLPMDERTISSCALIGRLANASNTGDRGSSNVRCPEVVSPYQGIKNALPEAELTLDGSDDVDAARKAAQNAQVAIVVAGYDAGDEGEFNIPLFDENPELLDLFPPNDGSEAAKSLTEFLKSTSERDKVDGFGTVGKGGDRASLRLRDRDVEIIRAVAKVNPRTIVCIVTAGAVIMEEWRHNVPTITQSWYSGTEGGNALADVLFGKVDASGRLPYSIPTHEEHLPAFNRNARAITYDRWHGQRLLDRLGVEAAFPLGFGLSYTTFALSDLTVKVDSAGVRIHVRVSNTGERNGRHVVQIYGKPLGAEKDFPSRLLLGFAPVEVARAESKELDIEASPQPLCKWEGGRFVLSSRDVMVEVGGYSGDPEALSKEVHLSDTL